MGNQELSQRQLAIQYSVSESALRTIKKKGIDIRDREAVREHFLTCPRRPDQWVNGCPWDEPKFTKPTPDEVSGEELDLMQQVIEAHDYDSVRTLKTKIDALHKLRQIEIQDRDYIHKDEVTDDMTRIGNGLKAGLLRLQADLPPMLEGLGANEMQKTLAAKINEMLSQWANESSELYKPEVLT
tara:strand:+ start:99 stop:650 length:552 start_codon:yes stop_codon:yes gene_type:complete